MEQFYSEYGEDRWIVGNLFVPPRGFYVDIGAGHPELNSNTAFLRDRAWDGLAIDGDPAWAPAWAERVHPGKGALYFESAIISDQAEVSFAVNAGNHWLSRLDPGGLPSRAVTLHRLLDRYQIAQIDFLSIDIEGHEYSVLATLDLKRYRPRVIVAEYHTLDIGKDFRSLELLLDAGYMALHRTVANIIYQRRE